MDKLLIKARRLAIYFYEFSCSIEYESLPKEIQRKFDNALEFWSLLGDLDTTDLDQLVPDDGFKPITSIKELEEDEEISQDYIDDMLLQKRRPTKSIKEFRSKYK